MEYITKETVLKMLNKIENAVEDGEGFQFNEWVGYVKELPTEEVQPIVHGRWKKDADNLYHCSVCGKPELTVCAFGKIENHTQYCPWCNAKMDGKEVEE